ncbi:hypothetical protein [Texcoconibacillus texcoconensis]|uniref:Sporulation protein n=1 Tax=Texcoconibacillus texcoconensis TaxID=1095777 RepID=A0A840QNK3_9BACI|nr:hypothetical protein [Texcoconibacillus texcoconensis]MBB5172962.1 hypothetical protein [Texcoconibacillus texcoconensis]
MKKIVMVGVAIICIGLLITACNSNPSSLPDHQTGFDALGSDSIVDQSRVDQMKKQINDREEVVTVHGVEMEDDVYINVKVKHRHRLFLERLRKEFHEIAQKVDQNATVHLSTDKRIEWDLDALESEIKNREISKERLRRELDNIEDNMKG